MQNKHPAPRSGPIGRDGLGRVELNNPDNAIISVV
jgi:hypothetical protein